MINSKKLPHHLFINDIINEKYDNLWNTSSNRKRLLIGGCSFSEPKGYIDNNGEYHGHILDSLV